MAEKKISVIGSGWVGTAVGKTLAKAEMMKYVSNCMLATKYRGTRLLKAVDNINEEINEK